MGRPPRHAAGAIGPPSASSSGRASAYEMGSTGIFVSVWAFVNSGRVTPPLAATPGVSGSPGYTGMSDTEPRCAECSFR